VTIKHFRRGALLNIRLDVLICLFLVISTLVVYWQVRNYEFVNYDDSLYVTDNLRVQAGLTLENVRWALTATQSSNWHPLTWMSHMLDCQLYGLHAGRHHLISMLFHIMNTLLLFLVFREMTGDLWQSSFIAALFALHPIHVESVAWAAERKNVLSTFFWMLTMWSYVRYSRHPEIKRYLLVMLVFVLGLMSKPMLVTLPFVLLLLDYWPLSRLQPGLSANVAGSLQPKATGIRLVLEKIPLFVFAGASCAVTLGVQPLYSFDQFPLHVRIANALVSYAGYIGKMIWPGNLACIYPYPQQIPAWKVTAAGLFLVFISFLAVRSVRRRPYFLVGWLWYLGTLVPVIGLVQVGPQAMADRYAYVPLVGLFIIIAWGFSDIAARWRHKTVLLSICAGMVLSALMVCTWFQVGRWQNSITLFEHALKITDDNWLAHTNFGKALFDEGRLDGAVYHYNKAITIKPDCVPALYNLGKALSDSGDIDRAAWFYKKVLKIEPDYVGAHNNLGNILAVNGNFDEAVRHYKEALRINSEDIDAHNNLANVLAAQGEQDEAVRHYTEAIRIDPGYANAHYNFGNLLAEMDQEKFRGAVTYFSKGIKIGPKYAVAYNQIGVNLARQGQLKKAGELFLKAIRIDPNYALARKNPADLK